MSEKAADNYLNSDAGGKEYKIARLFSLHKVMVDTMEHHTKALDDLNKRLDQMEQRMNHREFMNGSAQDKRLGFTLFSVELIKIRRAHDEVMYQMAKKLGMSSSELSAIQVGKSKVPSNMIARLKALYNLTDETVLRLEQAKAQDEQ